MFGYVRIKPSELRLRDYECYRAYYCGLCRAMGKCTGVCSKISLSYDFVFLAAVRSAMEDEAPETVNIRCLLHPFRRRKAVEHSPALNYCADASALLTYGKIADDLADEKGWKRVRARLASLWFLPAYRKARKRRPDLDACIQKQLEALRSYEKSDHLPSADEPASIFGDLMREVFANGLSETDARIAGEIGRAVGHWIYLVDAADDLESDRKHRRFNPYLQVFGAQVSKNDRETVQTGLQITLDEAKRAYDLMERFPFPELREILFNVLTLGMQETAERVLTKAQRKGDIS